MNAFSLIIVVKINTKSFRLPDGIAPNFISKPIVKQTQDSLLIQLELKANPTPSASWYLDNKDLSEVDSRYNTKIEKISADLFLLSLEIKVRFNFVLRQKALELILKEYLNQK